MKYWNKICGATLIFIFSSPFLEAQSSLSSLHFGAAYTINAQLFSSDTSFHFIFRKLSYSDEANPKQILMDNYSVKNYGFFCKQELKVEKATKIPLRFRLGSLHQCNYYEGKSQ
jgi:hypothetical protein